MQLTLAERHLSTVMTV